MEEKPLAVVRSQGGRSCRQLWSTFMVEETIAKKPGNIIFLGQKLQFIYKGKTSS
jgi:hypothetical protein